MKISSANLPQNVECPASKSYANRALILGSLKKQKISIFDLPEANDVKDMINVLKRIGLSITRNENELKILNSFPECEKKEHTNIKLNLGEGGTTSRFLFPLLCLGSNCYEVTLQGEMAIRPMDDLVEHLCHLGAKITKKIDGVYLLQGPIKLNGKIFIDCSKTTQFASALMHLEVNSKLQVKVVNVSASKKYIDMTEELITIFKTETSYRIPADYSSAGYFIAHSILTKDLQINNLTSLDTFQADSQLVPILESIGGELSFSTRGLKISKIGKFTQGINVDGSTCLDLVPTLMFLAAFIPYNSSIRNIKNLKFKECDRLKEMERILSNFSIKYSYSEEDDLFEIYPSKAYVKNDHFITVNDHRMVMILTLFYKQLGGGEVTPDHSVSKSFSDFFNFFQ
jgi:3-phosphoshikimate 1-carboxyvinyltransferase